MMKYVLFFVLLFSYADGYAQDKPSYAIFNKSGKQVDFGKMMNQLSQQDIVLFGEVHNNALAHWLELQVAKELYLKNKQLTLGMEMFEADNQLVLDEYLLGTIEEKHLMSEAKVWENYKTDYKPLVDFCKENHLKVLATNIPRRYANLVYRKGIHALDTLSMEVKRWMVPLPLMVDLELPGYQDMVHGMGPHPDDNSLNLVHSQAIKDATMAHFILSGEKGLLLHINGSYHSQRGEGIVWYLKKTKPELKVATIHIAEQSDISRLQEDQKDLADFIICLPEDMTKTY